MQSTYPLSRFDASSFKDLSGDVFVAQLWDFLTSPHIITTMEEGCAHNQAPIEPLIPLLQQHFGTAFDTPPNGERYKSLCLNMIRQVLQLQGYEHVACKLIPGGAFVTSAGLFRRCS
jgi:hypothetical protein